MDQHLMEKIILGDASDIRVADYSNKQALLIVAGVLSIAFLVYCMQVYLPSLRGLSVLLLLGTPAYGLYLGLSNKAVFYADKGDVVDSLLIFIIPLAIYLLFSMLVLDADNWFVSILGFLTALCCLASSFYFAMKSACSNQTLNSDLGTFNNICVVFAKVFWIWMLVVALVGNAGKAASSKNTLGERLNGAAAFAILALIGTYLYERTINAESVFEERGLMSREISQDTDFGAAS